MTDEDRFVFLLGAVESGANTRAWGDAGGACGRFQWHPAAYLSWQPTAEDYQGQEQTWDWAFEQAVRKFYRAAHKLRPGLRDVDIAMAYHLHGQLRFMGWDVNYAVLWDAQAKNFGL